MKTKLLLAFVVLCSLNSFGQSTPHPITDAIAFEKAAQNNDSLEMLKILRIYAATTSDLSEIENNIFIKVPGILNAFNSNDFLSVFADSDPSFSTKSRAEQLKFLDRQFYKLDPAESENARSGVGGTNIQGMLIDAVSSIIAERFREELTIAFLQQFRTKLKEDTYLPSIFPNTTKVLLYDDPFNYTAWLSTFKVSMELDLKEIPSNLPHIVNGIVQADTSLDKEAKKKLEATCNLYATILGLKEKANDSYAVVNSSVELIKTFVNNPKVNADINFVMSILKEFTNDDKWIVSSKLNQLKNPSAASFFMAFMIEKNKQTLQSKSLVVNGRATNFYNIFHVNPTGELAAIKDDILELVPSIVEKITPIEDAIIDLQNKISRKEPLKFDNYATLMKAVIGLTEELTTDEALDIVPSISATDKTKIKNVVSAVKSGVNISESINKAIADSNYSVVMIDLFKYLETIITNQDDLARNHFLQEFLKYGNLAINIANAETSEQMKEVIKASVLPTGSYRIKRNNRFSVGINSYAGIYGGVEYLQNDLAAYKDAGIFGFTAPIGISISWGLTRKDAKPFTSTHVSKTVYRSDTTIRSRFLTGSSFSVFMSIVDVGAIAAVRVQGDETPVGDIQFANIIAPGLYGSLGIGRTPLAFNFGVQYGPALRSVKAVDNSLVGTVDSRAWRASASLVVDIPLYNIYIKQEKVKKKN